MRLNHPKTIPRTPGSVEKLSSMKPVPGAKKVGDYWFRVYSKDKFSAQTVVTLALEVLPHGAQHAGW